MELEEEEAGSGEEAEGRWEIMGKWKWVMEDESSLSPQALSFPSTFLPPSFLLPSLNSY